MMNATVTGNTTNFAHSDTSNCPNVNFGAAVAAVWASGTIQGPFTDVDFPTCIVAGS